MISLPAIINKINDREQKLTDALYESVKAAANIYAENNFDNNATHHIKFDTLVKEGLLDNSILKDYKDYCVAVSRTSNQYRYEIEANCTEE